MYHELSQRVKDTMHTLTREMHTVLPGKIKKYDPDTNKAVVTPIMKWHQQDGSQLDFPDISDVPVVVPQWMNQDARIVFPVKPGDGCLLAIGEQSLDFWRYGYETANDLPFDITNAIAITGLFVPANKLMKEAVEKEAIIVDVKDARVRVKENELHLFVKGTEIKMSEGEVLINTGGDINIHAGGNLTITTGGVVNVN